MPQKRKTRPAHLPGRTPGASAATAATGLRRLFLCFCFSRRSSETRCRCCRGRPPVLLRVLVGSVAAVAVAQAKTAEWPRANTASRRWHWRSGDRPSCLSGPRRKEPRSAAERLLALETKFLLFCQDRNKTLSGRGHRHPALIVRRRFANETCR